MTRRDEREQLIGNDCLVALAQTAKVDAIVSLDRDLLDAQLDRIGASTSRRPRP